MDAGKPQTAAELNGRTCLKLLIKTVCTHSASLTPSVCNPCAALSKAEVFFVREFNPKQIDTWKGSQRHVRVLDAYWRDMRYVVVVAFASFAQMLAAYAAIARAERD